MESFLRFVRIGQGVQWLWTLGGGTLVTALGGGMLAAFSALPWWAVGGAMFGLFLLTVALIGTLIDRLWPASPLTPVIEKALTLRDRLVSDAHTEREQAVVDQWRLRIDDWTKEAVEVIRSIDPRRVAAFTVGLLVSDMGYEQEIPVWKAELLLDLDIQIERLIVLRAST